MSREAAKPPHASSAGAPQNIFTDVVVEVSVSVVKVLVDDDLLHSKLLLHVGFALIQSVFPQDDRETATFPM